MLQFNIAWQGVTHVVMRSPMFATECVVRANEFAKPYLPGVSAPPPLGSQCGYPANRVFIVVVPEHIGISMLWRLILYKFFAASEFLVLSQ